MKNNNSRKGIINKISTRFQTTIIGSLARCEENFGYLWGHNTDPNIPLTEQQEKFLDLWEATRTAILNHGNAQLREAIDDIIDFIEVDNNTYRYDFVIKNKNNKEQ